MTNHPRRQRADGKTIIEERTFQKQQRPDHYIENPDAPGQWVTPEYLEAIRAQLADAVADRTGLEKLDPETKKLAEELAVLHLPEHRVNDRKIAEPTRVEIYQSQRMAAYLIRRGWRWHEEHEHVRWLPTPDGHGQDLGIHIERAEDGTWPVPDPEAFYDAERISTAQTNGGKWIASHPCGLWAEATTKTRAYARLVTQLMKKIDDAHADLDNATATTPEDTEHE